VVQRTEGRFQSGEDFEKGWVGGEPERSKSLGEQKSPTRAKPLGSEKGNGFSGGMKPLKHRYQVVGFGRRVHERRGEGKPSFDHWRGEKL